MKNILPDSFYDKVNRDSKQQTEDMINYLETLFEISPESKSITIEELYEQLKDGLKNWTDLKKTDYFDKESN